MRGPVLWITVIVVGLLALTGVVAIAGADDNSGETVSAAEWATGVCGAVGVWRGEMKLIADDMRTPSSAGATEEPQSTTKHGSSGQIRQALERAVRATKTMVTGVDNAGTPQTPQGEQAAATVSDWADSAVSSLDNAQDTLDKKPQTLEEAFSQLGSATIAIRAAVTGGIEALAHAGTLDPQLATAIRDSSTCQELRDKEQSS